jgi:hypothetical protein
MVFLVPIAFGPHSPSNSRASVGLGAHRGQTARCCAKPVLLWLCAARALASALPATGRDIGDVVEVEAPGGSTWLRYRVQGSTETTGLVRLTMEDADVR